jgi:hypothetical protein
MRVGEMEGRDRAGPLCKKIFFESRLSSGQRRIERIGIREEAVTLL